MEKKKATSAKGLNKRGSSVKSNPMSQDKEKRYSKSKFRKEVSESREEVTKELKPMPTVKPSTPKYTFREEQQVKFQEKDKKESWYGILLKDTLPRRGYKVIPRGNCVRAERFADSPYIRSTTTDGRIGIDYGGTVTTSMFER